MKRIFALLLAVITAAALCACTSAEITGIVEHFGKKEPVSALYYWKGQDGMEYVELDESGLSRLIEGLNKLPYVTKGWHTDYYWGGRFGLEIKFSDGTYWDYDGTCLMHRSESMTVNADTEANLSRIFAEITEGDFWMLMDEAFPDIDMSVHGRLG